MWWRPGCRIAYNKRLLADVPKLLIRKIERRNINVLPEANQPAFGVKPGISDVAQNAPSFPPRSYIAVIHVGSRDKEQSPADVEKKRRPVSDPRTQDARGCPSQERDMAAGPGMHSPPERALQDSDAILGRQTVQPCARNAFWYVNGLPFFGIAQVRSLATRTQTVPSASACPCADLELTIGPGQSR
jgi:hypothetical protein